jgi:PIN domain nuclease of toxin-antitoxin system
MRLLLDTHALLWWFQDSRLSIPAKRAIADPDNDVFVSSASAWEIASKQRAGKLLDAPAADRFFAAVANDPRYQQLPITVPHALLAGSFPYTHRDPFDRMLCAQAQIEGLTLVTIDPLLAGFGIPTLW